MEGTTTTTLAGSTFVQLQVGIWYNITVLSYGSRIRAEVFNMLGVLQLSLDVCDDKLAAGGVRVGLLTFDTAFAEFRDLNVLQVGGTCARRDLAPCDGDKLPPTTTQSPQQTEPKIPEEPVLCAEVPLLCIGATSAEVSCPAGEERVGCTCAGSFVRKVVNLGTCVPSKCSPGTLGCACGNGCKEGVCNAVKQVCECRKEDAGVLHRCPCNEVPGLDAAAPISLCHTGVCVDGACAVGSNANVCTLCTAVHARCVAQAGQNQAKLCACTAGAAHCLQRNGCDETGLAVSACALVSGCQPFCPSLSNVTCSACTTDALACSREADSKAEECECTSTLVRCFQAGKCGAEVVGSAQQLCRAQGCLACPVTEEPGCALCREAFFQCSAQAASESAACDCSTTSIKCYRESSCKQLASALTGCRTIAECGCPTDTGTETQVSGGVVDAWRSVCVPSVASSMVGDGVN